jgi:hypothetical protein
VPLENSEQLVNVSLMVRDHKNKMDYNIPTIKSNPSFAATKSLKISKFKNLTSANKHPLQGAPIGQKAMNLVYNNQANIHNNMVNR